MTGPTEHEYEVHMPFVTVVSVGGDHDDRSYVAGYECGALDAELKHARPAVVERYFHAANVPQIDLIAMSNGYKIQICGEDAEWRAVRLEREAVAST